MNTVTSELLRKTVHISMGGFALLLRFLTPGQAAVCACLALGFNLFVLHRLTQRALLRHTRKPAATRSASYVPRRRARPDRRLPDRLPAAAAWGRSRSATEWPACSALPPAAAAPLERGQELGGFIAFVLGTAAAFLIRWTQQGALDGPKTWIGASFLAVGAHGSTFGPTISSPGASRRFCSPRSPNRPHGVDDNILAVGGAALYAATLVDPQRFVDFAGACAGFRIARWSTPCSPSPRTPLAVSTAPARCAAGVSASRSTPSGWRGFVTPALCSAPRTKIATRKALLGIAQEGGRRGQERHRQHRRRRSLRVPRGRHAAPHPFPRPRRGFATAAADTVSSEIGQAFGRTTYLVTSFTRVPAGTEGAVSLEGTLAGVAASTVPAAFAAGVSLITWPGAAVVVAAAFVGTTLESYLGATLQRTDAIDNEVVNFANTLAGGLAAMSLSLLL